ncbi:RHS repeat-associated core domain-containing protein [Amycolatopsis sp. NPDC050768]|uniref:RHS repeat-associated core domain-containing protein n=1 Tax=Amycolatopsis sp. NPDC050768 TaxID=3154839 RepID=UPI0033CC21E6
MQAAQKGCEGASSADAQRGWVDTNFYAIVTDLVGSPQELVDDGGRVVWHARHTAWGAEPGAAVPAGPATTPLRFPGQYHDAETGLHYNFYRYYDPAQAHYLSRDPLGMRAGPNPRAYVPYPTTMLDPLGLFMCVQSEAEEVADIASRNNFPTAMASVLRPAGHDQNSVFYGFSGRGNHDIRTGRQGSYANQNRLNGRNPETHKLPGGTTQHPRLTQALNNVPPNRRAENFQHGGCAEMDAVNQALHDSRGRPLTRQALQNRLDDLNGGRMGIAGVDSKTGGLSDRQGRYFPPCTTCDHVLGQFGIRPSGHSDPTLPARPLPQAAPDPAPAPAPAAPAPALAPAPTPTPAPAPAPAPSGPAPSSSTAPPKPSWADIAKRR